MAINRAMPQYIQKSIQEFASVYNSAKACIFISHKSEDLDAAKKIGDYILNNADVDIYLDYNDKGLRDAIYREDDIKIVECIINGLKRSTHLLCLISDQTKTSWWVPYEIGIAKNSERDIASLKLKNIEDVPSFLKIEKVINGTKSLNEYLENIAKNIHISKSCNIISHSANPHPLDSVLNWQI